VPSEQTEIKAIVESTHEAIAIAPLPARPVKAIVENEEASCHLVVPNMGPLRVTQPLQKYPGLFKSFAKLEPTAAGVAMFANRFGLLQDDPNQNRLADWFKRSRDFARVSNGTSASLSEASSLTNINEIIRTTKRSRSLPELALVALSSFFDLVS
jgi:hypothetical protein